MLSRQGSFELLQYKKYHKMSGVIEEAVRFM